MRIKPIWPLFALVCSLLLAACAPAAASLPTLTPEPPPTFTLLPSATLVPTSTLTPTLTATLPPTDTPTATLSPTPAADFASYQVTSIENLVGGVRITVKLTGVQVPYIFQVNLTQYPCELDPAYPDRLFCRGLGMPPLEQAVQITFLDPLSLEAVYQDNGFLPASLGPQAGPPCVSETWCPLRGQGFTCETECRVTPEGDACLVSTCFDACGYCTSVNTCPANMQLPTPKCNDRQRAYLQSLYPWLIIQ